MAVSNFLNVSNSPHIKNKTKTQNIMLDVIIAMAPIVVASTIIFGIRSLLVTLTAVVSCVLFEHVFCLIIKKDTTIYDLSAVVTGMLLAFNLPATIPLWMVVIGSFFAIVIAKQLFGGIGQNFVNPALFARVVMLASFASAMTTWPSPANIKVISSATPLALIAKGDMASLVRLPDVMDMFLGERAGCLGETCILTIIIGFIYLVVRKVISPIIPVTFIATTAILSLVMYPDINVLISIMSGGIFLGAVFMATDYTTSPISTLGKIIFGVGCGVITMIIRRFASSVEGVSYAILFMNLLVPYIDKLTRPIPFGVKKQRRAKA